MSTVLIVCPHCGYSKEVARSAIPEGRARVTCPRCREGFPLDLPEEPAVSLPADAHPTAADRGPSPPFPPEGGEPPFPRNGSSPEHRPVRRRELSAIGELFAQSWELFKERIGVLLVLYLVIFAALLIPLAIFGGLGFAISMALPGMRLPLLIGGGVAGGIVALVAVYWGGAALVFAVTDSSIGVRAALEKGWERLGSFLWLYSIAIFVILGGFVLGILPGVIFYVWFFFAQFILAAEGHVGLAALQQSREYIRGRFLDVFFRLFVMGLVSLAVGWVPIVGSVLSLVVVPFSLIYHYRIYAELREIRGTLPPPRKSGERFVWLGAGVLGHVILILIALLVALRFSSVP